MEQKTFTFTQEQTNLLCIAVRTAFNALCTEEHNIMNSKSLMRHVAIEMLEDLYTDKAKLSAIYTILSDGYEVTEEEEVEDEWDFCDATESDIY